MSEKRGFFGKLARGLSKTRDSIAAGFDSIFSGFSGLDDDFYEELEEILIMSDMGICYATSGCDIQFTEFVDRPTAFFIKIPVLY